MLKHLGLDVVVSKRRKESATTKTLLRWAVSTIRLRLSSSHGVVRLGGEQAENLERVGSLIPGKPCPVPTRRRGSGAAGSLRSRPRAEAAQAAVVRGGSTRRRTSPRGARSIGRLKPLSEATGLRAESKALKSQVGVLARETAEAQAETTRGHRPGTTRRGSARRNKPLRGGNPVRGCGVKQTRKTGRGANRRGREERRGRTVAEGGGAFRNRWLRLVDVAKRAHPNPMGGAFDTTGCRQMA
jgi:hypothetical protein